MMYLDSARNIECPSFFSKKRSETLTEICWIVYYYRNKPDLLQAPEICCEWIPSFLDRILLRIIKLYKILYNSTEQYLIRLNVKFKYSRPCVSMHCDPTCLPHPRGIVQYNNILHRSCWSTNSVTLLMLAVNLVTRDWMILKISDSTM